MQTKPLSLCLVDLLVGLCKTERISSYSSINYETTTATNVFFLIGYFDDLHQFEACLTELFNSPRSNVVHWIDLDYLKWFKTIIWKTTQLNCPTDASRILYAFNALNCLQNLFFLSFVSLDWNKWHLSRVKSTQVKLSMAFQLSTRAAFHWSILCVK